MLKNRFSPQNPGLERAAIADRQGSSEDVNFERTTDSSGFLSTCLIPCLLLLLTACHSGSHWAFDQIQSEEKEHRSTRLCRRSSDCVNGIDLEMIKTADHLKVYLAVHSSPIQPHAQDSKRADVHFTCEGKTEQYSCHRLEGGQRILLSDEAAAFLIRSFQEGKKVTLSLPGYQSTVEGTAFTASFAKLEKPFPYPNLIHLPF